MFQSVAAIDGAVTFSALKPVPADESTDVSWNISLQFLLNDGSTDNDNDYTWDGEKWLKDGWEDVSNNPIPAGQGLWVGNGTFAAVSLQSSGEVTQKDYIEYLMNDEGGTAIGNCYPTAIKFADIIPVAASPDTDVSWNIGLQFLLNDGGTDNDNDYTWDGEKWLKDGWEDVSNNPIPAGKAFWVGNGTFAPVSLKIILPGLSD